MLGIFKKRNWCPESLDELRGSFGGLNIELSNVACRADRESGYLSYAYPDFGSEFIEELHRQLGDYEDACSCFDRQAAITTSVTLRTFPPILVKVSGKKPTSRKQYYSDLADAVLNAFNTRGLKP